MPGANDIKARQTGETYVDIDIIYKGFVHTISHSYVLVSSFFSFCAHLMFIIYIIIFFFYYEYNLQNIGSPTNGAYRGLGTENEKEPANCRLYSSGEARDANSLACPSLLTLN